MFDRVDEFKEIAKQYCGNKSVSDAVYCTLSDCLLKGVFQPGTRIFEAEIAELIEVSRTPVREAIKKLIQEGLLAYTDHGNVCVKKYSVEEICSIIQCVEDLRIILSREATESINRIYIKRIQEVIDQIDQISLEYPGDKDRNRAEKVYDLDEEFHKLICEATGNPYMIEFYNRLTKMLTVIQNSTLYSEMAYAYSFEAQHERKQILQALIERNPAKALEFSLIHSQRAFDRMNVITSIINNK